MSKLVFKGKTAGAGYIKSLPERVGWPNGVEDAPGVTIGSTSGTDDLLQITKATANTAAVTTKIISRRFFLASILFLVISLKVDVVLQLTAFIGANGNLL